MRKMKQGQARFGLGMAGLLSAGLWAGCSTMHSSAKVDPSLIAGFSSDQLAPVSQQQGAVDSATANRLNAIRTRDESQRLVGLAESDLSAAQADLKRAEAEASIAHKTYEQAKKPATDESQATLHPVDIEASLQRMGKADTAVRDAKARTDAEEMKLDYAKALKDHSDAKVKVADSQIELEKAKLEKERFVALNSSDPARVRSMKMNAATFDAAVADKQANLAGANADVAKARADATNKYRTWISRGESYITPGRERASVPHPPQG